MGERKKIKIIGGGFAGVKCALTLRKKLKREEADIILYNSENYLVFQPLLAEVVGASISPEPVAVSLRQMLPGVYCRTEDITRIDVNSNYVEYLGDEGQKGQMYYDHLVIACGSSVNLGLIPGMSDHAFPLKTVGDAVALRYHVMQQMENAEICEDVERRRWYLSFVIVGGGFSGVEVAGEINDLVHDTRKFFRNIPKEEIKVTAVPGASSLMNALVLSGFPIDSFRSLGWLSPKREKREQELRRLIHENETSIIMETPYRLVQLLESCQKVLGGKRFVAVCCQLTTENELIKRGELSSVLRYFKNHPEKREFVLVVAGKKFLNT